MTVQPAMPDLEHLLTRMVSAGASDLHMASGAVPALRIDGVLCRQMDMGHASPDWMAAALNWLASHYNAADYTARGSADFGVSAHGQRFRVNLFRHRGGDALVVRHLGSDLASLEALHLPAALEELTRFDAGLVLVCGATGSGKSTTLAALINMINQTARRHILTIEDPVEYVHADQASIVRQRELGPDAPDFATAVRAALREDPDVILVGEMRDVETMRAALTAAETGHLVFSTLHTGDVVGAIRRLVGAFPANEQDAVRLRLSQSLRAALAQHLLPHRSGRGRAPAVELMFITTAIRHMISANKLDQIYSAVESGGAAGMCTLEQSLAALLRRGLIEERTAFERCGEPEALRRMIEGGSPQGGARMALSEQDLIEAGRAIGLIGDGALEDARRAARQQRLPLIEAVSREVRRPVAAFMQAAAEKRGVPFLHPSALNPDPADMDRLPRGFALRRKCLPLRAADGRLIVALADPDDMATLDQVSRALGETGQPVLAHPEALIGAIERALGEGMAESLGAEDATGLLEEILHDAYMEEASDVHLQPVDRHMRVRYRVDGILRDWRRDLRPGEHEAVVNRIKVLADLDIAESRAPQDGGFRQALSGFHEALIELRISTLPVRGGERVVMRLLGAGTERLGLADLGLGPALAHDLAEAIRSPHGVLLVTGPTGSGKSTTLYAALRDLDRQTRNVITVEDPIEQEVEGASQVQVSVKLGFAGALRTILRQDPDVILVGEIRDGETADIALKAAQTGHLVFSTLHTNTAIGAITRLSDLGVGRWQVAASLNGVLAQRLVPLLCTHCRRPRKATEEENRLLGRAPDDPTPIHEPVGCPFCLNTGFHGRTGVFEALWIDDALRDMIAGGASEGALRKAARRHLTLSTDLIARVTQGRTPISVARAMGLGSPEAARWRPADAPLCLYRAYRTRRRNPRRAGGCGYSGGTPEPAGAGAASARA